MLLYLIAAFAAITAQQPVIHTTSPVVVHYAQAHGYMCRHDPLRPMFDCVLFGKRLDGTTGTHLP